MHTPIEKFFDAIFVINLQRRPDRWRHFQLEMEQIGVTEYERFDAIDYGPRMGNHACCASHRAVMGLIVDRGYKNALVFEDDNTVRSQYRDSFNNEVEAPLRELPHDWDALYLGGGFGDDPQGWHSKHLIRINSMKTTSSYGVTAATALGLRDYIPPECGQGIDDIVSGYLQNKNAFICEPRLFIQYNNYSDLQRAVLDNGQSMSDTGHLKRLGNYHPL